MAVFQEELHSSLWIICWDRNKRRRTLNRRKKSFGLLFVCLLLVGSLSGCIGKTTPKSIVVKMGVNLSKVHSFANEISIDVKLEDVIHVTEVGMDMVMESTMDPKAGHAKGTASIKLFDTKLESPIEIYQVMEDGQSVTYSGMDQIWQRSVSEEEGVSGISLNGGMLQDLETLVDQFTLAGEPVEVNGKECYEIYGKIKGADLLSLVGEDFMNAYGLVEIPEKEALYELGMPVTIDIYKEEMLPARIHIDMTDEMNEFYDQIKETMNVNDFAIDIRFSNYNEVDEITVPDEVKELV